MIAEMLPKGKANAISTNDLCILLGIGNIRTLRAMIAEERKEGKIIASCSTGGYYIPTEVEEIEEFVRTLDSKARSIMVALQASRKLLKVSAYKDQITFEDDEIKQIWTDRGGWQ